MKKLFAILLIFFSLSVFGQTEVLIYQGDNLIEDGDNLVGGTIDTITVETFTVVPNSGSLGTSDWNDSNLDGLGDYWNLLGLETPSIVTGNGFTNNAQRIEYNNVTQLTCDLFGIISGTTYQLQFKYRHNWNTLATHVYVRNSVGSVTVLDLIDQNTGDAVFYISNSFSIIDTEMDIYIWFNNEGALRYFEIDEVELISEQERIIIY